MIVTQIIYGQYEGFLIRRKHQGIIPGDMDNTVFIRCFNAHIIQPDHNIAGIVHLLDHGIKLSSSGHGRVVLPHPVRADQIRVERPVIVDQGMEEHMRYSGHIHRHTLGFPVFAVFNGIQNGGILITDALQERNRSVIVITSRKLFRLSENRGCIGPGRSFDILTGSGLSSVRIVLRDITAGIILSDNGSAGRIRRLSGIRAAPAGTRSIISPGAAYCH